MEGPGTTTNDDQLSVKTDGSKEKEEKKPSQLCENCRSEGKGKNVDAMSAASGYQRSDIS